jgi:hypothetical protein
MNFENHGIWYMDVKLWGMIHSSSEIHMKISIYTNDL